MTPPESPTDNLKTGADRASNAPVLVWATLVLLVVVAFVGVMFLIPGPG